MYEGACPETNAAVKNEEWNPLFTRSYNNSVWSGKKKPTNLEHNTSVHPLRTYIVFSLLLFGFTLVPQLKLVFHFDHNFASNQILFPRHLRSL